MELERAQDSRLWENYTPISRLWDIQSANLCDSDYMPKRTEGLSDDYASYKHTLGVAVGARIRSRRLTMGLSQEKIRAQMQLENVYVSRTQFSRLELGESLPDAAEIIALAKVLRVSPGWLLLEQESSDST